MITVGRNGYLARLLCPYCGRIHIHGAGSGDPVLGERMSHCRSPKPYTLKKLSPFSAHGGDEGRGVRENVGKS